MATTPKAIMNDDLEPGWYTSDSGAKRYWTGSEWITPTAPPAMEEPSSVRELPEHRESDNEVEETEETEQEDVTLISHLDDPAPPLKPTRDRRKRILALTLLATILLGSTGAGIAYYQHHAEQQRVAEAQALAEQQAREAEALRAQEEAERQAQEEADRQAEERQQAEQRRRDERARKERESLDEQFTSGTVGAKFDVLESGNLYFRYLEDDELTCGYWSCVAVGVVSMTGCPGGVYVEASLLDGNGNVIGYANARMGSLRAEEQGLEMLETSQNGVASFRVETVNCRK